ncbi:hypothetical protein DFH08DRAFT_1075105 [Mycena albidolilacea]|uniref:Uncharacterized protein n=1 Tax=Mycena albidolilacea TaxID=1033008 RepID=A0AAD7AIM9_9AGAR|nr:hypothetical protein DFH08DRAFT_1075105 [Mycena albidolilacea]
MVALKNKKVMKYTYTERVLGSVLQIQKEHKKHAIHLASLRAQILKTANARKDKLGPHWKNWVGKAVHRLEEDGILSSELAGTVTLTPDGKKAILAARRALALPAHDSLSPDQEDLLWKQVTHPNSVQVIASAVKRARHIDDPTDEEDSEPEYVPQKARKRARTSRVASKTSDPAFKMTKAQLVEELAIMRRAQEADRMRAESPLTELEDDESEEVMRLKEILKNKDAEMYFLQRQLASRNSDTDMEISSPLRPNLNAIIRTQSGSLIDHLSKQPTPAPTERDPDDCGDDTFDETDSVSVPPFINPLVTPAATPAKSQSRIQMNEISSREHLPSSEQQNDLVRKLAEVESQHTYTQKSLSDKTSHISILQTNLALCETQISEKDAAISEIERARADLEATVAEKAAQVERLVHERADAISSLKNEKNKHDRLRAELNAQSETANIRESDIATLQSELGSQRASCAELHAERARLEEELSAQRGLVGMVDESNQGLVARVAELDQRVEEHSAVELSLKEELAGAEAELSTASEKLLDAEVQNRVLSTRLAEATEKLAAARQGLADARAAAESLKPQMAALDDALTKRISSHRELQEQLAKTQRDAETSRMKVGILEAAAATLRMNLEEKTLHAEQLACNVAERVDTHSALLLELKETQQQLTDVTVSKDALQSTLNEVTSKLQLALGAEAQLRESRDRMDGQLAAVDAAKRSLIAELAATSAMVQGTAVKLREAEAREATLGTEITAKDQEMERLRVQLDASVGRAQELQENLDAAEARYDSHLAERESAHIALDGLLLSARGDVTRLTAEVSSLQRERDGLKNDAKHISDALEAEKLRGKSIEAECADANGRVQEVEQELLELRASKDADATTIEGLKDVFSQLKATQMESLAELDTKLFLLDFIPWMIHGTSTATRVAIIVLDGAVLI